MLTQLSTIKARLAISTTDYDDLLINAIKTVLSQAEVTRRYDTAHRIALKIKDVLKIESDLDVNVFLEKLLEDYNYLATKEM